MSLMPTFEIGIWNAWIFMLYHFLPLRLGTMWFYVGLPITIIGLIGFTIVNVSWATSPMETKLITRGIYRYSRHPFYVTQMVMFIGVGIAADSWVFLLFSIVYSFLHFVIAIPEERFLLDKYGNTYREYVSKTPRWIGIPKA